MKTKSKPKKPAAKKVKKTKKAVVSKKSTAKPASVNSPSFGHITDPDVLSPFKEWHLWKIISERPVVHGSFQMNRVSFHVVTGSKKMAEAVKNAAKQRSEHDPVEITYVGPIFFWPWN